MILTADELDAALEDALGERAERDRVRAVLEQAFFEAREAAESQRPRGLRLPDC